MANMSFNAFFEYFWIYSRFVRQYDLIHIRFRVKKLLEVDIDATLCMMGTFETSLSSIDSFSLII